MGPKFVRESTGDGWAHGRLGNVVTLVYRSLIPFESVEQSFELIDRAAQVGAGVAVVAIFGERASPPSARSFTAIARGLGRRAPSVAIGATVLEGSSLASTSKRAVVGMMTTLLEPPYPHRIFGAVAEAARFVAPRAVAGVGREPLGPQALLDAFTELASDTLSQPG